MKNIGAYFFLLFAGLLFIFVDCFHFAPSNVFRRTPRHKRALVYPEGDNYIQYILGIGLPIELRQQSITIGTVAKMTYRLPTNSSFILDHVTITESMRRKRSRESPLNRWRIYENLVKAAEGLGFGGKACVLQTICEVARFPFDHEHGEIIDEVLHVLFTPSATPDGLSSYADNEYFAAEEMGKNNEECKQIFPECEIDFLNTYTKVL